MKHIDDYRDATEVKHCVDLLARIVTRPWTIMEVCGGQTHAIVRHGIDELLPAGITLVHGPGCPVCVTPIEIVDQALQLAAKPGVVFCSFGDMLRVPGSRGDLLGVKAGGGDVRIVYSPLDAVKIAAAHPDKEVVFFAVGFETTAPANALAVAQAEQMALRNFSLLVSHVLVPPAMEALLTAPECKVQGFLAAGHVCAVMGVDAYEPLVRKYQVPIVVTGFEPLDILQGIAMCVRQLEEGRCEVENQYARTVRAAGNLAAQRLLKKVFRITERTWRGMGTIPQSGFTLRDEYAGFDATRRFELEKGADEDVGECISGLILQGVKRPADCPAFATRCSPEHPLGATMVSSEGACAAYYRYRGRSVTHAK